MRVAQRVRKGLNWCTYSSPQLPLKKNGSNTTPKLHLLVFSDQSKGKLTESQGPTKRLLILKYWSEHILLLLNTHQQYLALTQCLLGEDVQMLFRSIIFLSPRRKDCKGRPGNGCKESNSTWAEEAAIGPPRHKSLVPKCHAHSHHCLKHGNIGVHISIQDCHWLLLSPIKELFSPPFLSFSNLKENIYHSLWGQYLWENCVASVLFLIM